MSTYCPHIFIIFVLRTDSNFILVIV